MYGKGISREGSLLDVAVNLGFVKKSGAWFTYEGEQLGQGRENAKEFLAENPQLMAEIDRAGAGPAAPAEVTPGARGGLDPKTSRSRRSPRSPGGLRGLCRGSSEDRARPGRKTRHGPRDGSRHNGEEMVAGLGAIDLTDLDRFAEGFPHDDFRRFAARRPCGGTSPRSTRRTGWASGS